MPRIVIRQAGEKHSDPDDKHPIIRNRFFFISLIILIAGLAIFGGSNLLVYHYYNNYYQGGHGTFSNDNIANVTFTTQQGYPTNITFTFENLTSANYRLYTIGTGISLGLPVTIVHFINSGNVTNNETIVFGAGMYSKNYFMLLSPNVNGTYRYNVSVEITIPQQHRGNPLLGVPGMYIAVIGATALAISVSKTLLSK